MALSRSQLKTNTKVRLKKPDFTLTVLIAAMVVVGLIMISSASVVMSKTVANKENHFLLSQLFSAGIGLVAMFVASLINYKFWKRFAFLMLVFNIILLLAVFIPGLGFHHGGANRWILLGSFNFQPSETMKLTLIIYLALWLENRGKEIKSFSKTTMPFGILMIVILALIMKQPDMGTGTVLAVIGGSMFFVAGASLLHIGAILGVAVGAVAALIKAAPYRLARLTIFLNPSADDKGIGYHINQALLAVGSGGILGLGFGRSRQKFNYLPEAATDSIFAVISEELGLIRASLIIVLFILFAFRGYKIAKNTPDTYGRLLAFGITTWVIAQAFINILAILSMMPLTGVPLPFISYGGTSLITIMFSCGILLNISRYSQGGEDESTRFGRGNRGSYFARFSRYFGA